MDRSILQVSQNKTSSPLTPVLGAKTPAQLLLLHAPAPSLQPSTPAVLSSSTKPSGVTVKWNKNKADRKGASQRLWFSREQTGTTGKHNAPWRCPSDMRLFSVMREKESRVWGGLLQQLTGGLWLLFEDAPSSLRRKPAS